MNIHIRWTVKLWEHESELGIIYLGLKPRNFHLPHKRPQKSEGRNGVKKMIDSLSGKAGVAAKWGQTSNVQKSTEKAAKSAMTDGFVERIRAYAKEDAKKGDYMSPEFIQMRLEHMNKYVSPDRSGPKAEVMSAIQAAVREPHPLLQALEKMLDKLSGGGKANLKIRGIQQAAEIMLRMARTLQAITALAVAGRIYKRKKSISFSAKRPPFTCRPIGKPARK